MTETRWLTPAEQRAWRAFVESAKVVFDELDRRLQQSADMPHAYFEVLVRLSEAPERSLRMSELADLTRSSRSRLSHAVARLEERGWVRRASCETDRRGQVAVLTDAGFDVLELAAPGHVDAVRELVIDGLAPAQVRQLTEIGARIVERVAAAADGQTAEPSAQPSGGREQP